MHDPKFEKTVQEKMEELSFVPSDAVWQGVERAVQGERRRRVAPLWFFLFPLAMLAGGGIVYFWTRPGGQTAMNRHEVVKRADGPSKPSAHIVKGAAIGEVNSLNRSAGAEGENGDEAGNKAVNGEALVKTGGAKVHAASNRTGQLSKQNRSEYTGGSDSKPDLQPDHNNAEGNAADGVTPGLTVGTAIREPKPASTPGLIRLGKPGAAIGANPLAKAAVSTDKLSSPKRPWRMGYTVGGGASFLNQGLLQGYSIVTYDYLANAAISGAPHASQNHLLPGPSFYAGVDLQKELTSRFSLELQLNLRYYSSRVRTGSKVDNSQVSNLPGSSNSLSFNYQSAAASYPSVYYNQGTSEIYNNRYYFLELPASIHYQIRRRATLPIYFDGGANLSYLLGSSALYYNSKTGIYYKDFSYIKKTQVNLFAGFLVGVPMHGLDIQVGPQVQYGLTNLSSDGTSKQHLLYGGIKMVFLPKKSAKKGIRN